MSKKYKIKMADIVNKIDYNPETGAMVWKYTRGRCQKGKQAGWELAENGRRMVRIDGNDYPASALAWFISYRKWPKKKILFKNGDQRDLRIENLRDSGVKERPDQARIKQLLHYNPETGIFTWKDIGRNKGKKAGVVSYWGYLIIGIDGGRYQASRLAWVYMEGYWPEYQIDHIDRDTLNNSWENLRHITEQCNIRNRGINSNNTSGVTGVSYHKNNGRWYVDIVDKHVGSFDNFDDAVMARWNAEKVHAFPNCQTTSPAYLYLKEKGLI